MLFQLSEATASYRRVPIHLVDATDGLTAETGVTGTPQISKAGGAWGNTSATLVEIGDGAYYVELTAGELDTRGLLFVRFKSVATAEFQDAHQVVAFDPYSSSNMGLSNLDAAVTTRSSLTSGNIETAVAAALNTAVPGSPVADSTFERIKTIDDAYTAARAAKIDNLDAAVTTRATPAQVNTEVLDVMAVDTYAEPGAGAPPVTSTLAQKLTWLFTAWRNKQTSTDAVRTLYADNGSTEVAKSSIGETAGLFTRDEWVAP
jgi:hypothetical protein